LLNDKAEGEVTGPVLPEAPDIVPTTPVDPVIAAINCDSVIL
jgi:hypothetical protein